MTRVWTALVFYTCSWPWISPWSWGTCLLHDCFHGTTVIIMWNWYIVLDS